MAQINGTPDLEAVLQERRAKREEFSRSVRVEEAAAAEDPKGQRNKLVWLVVLAYGYIFGVLFVALLMIAGIVAIMIEASLGNAALVKVAILLLLFVVAILKSLWVKFSPPQGIRIYRSDAPELYREVDAIADRLKAPRAKEIRIDWQLNAAAVQLPRLGIFGWYRNTLLLGLPLLLALSPDEARAVIAHEFGHFSGAHGKFGAWIYRVERTWSQMARELHRSKGSWVFKDFVNWFFPRFEAKSFVLRRANEFEADRAAAGVVAAPNLADGLMRLTFLEQHLDDHFWTPLQSQTAEMPSPPPHVLSSMPKVLGAVAEPSLVQKNLAMALSQETGYEDSHPCLTDRLRAIDQLPEDQDATAQRLSGPPEVSAAARFLGPSLPSVMEKVGHLFSTTVSKSWAQSHARALQLRESLANLDARASREPLSDEDALERAFVLDQLFGAERSESEFRTLYEKLPEHPGVLIGLGSILADRGDLDAEPMLQSALAKAPRSAEHILRKLAKLYQESGHFDKLSQLKDRADEALTTRAVVASSARRLALTDALSASAAPTDKLQDRLHQVPKLDVAYLVEKTLPDGEKLPLLIAFHQRGAMEGKNEPQKLVNALVTIDGLPQGTMIHSPLDRKAWVKRLDGIAGARIYSRR